MDYVTHRDISAGVDQNERREAQNELLLVPSGHVCECGVSGHYELKRFNPREQQTVWRRVEEKASGSVDG
jgi:hypothetical protein|tara:strand:- start:1799 stop:2008 length:210 start_codon:yes stop_codon:yes gene_type:complete